MSEHKVSLKKEPDELELAEAQLFSCRKALLQQKFEKRFVTRKVSIGGKKFDPELGVVDNEIKRLEGLESFYEDIVSELRKERGIK